MFFSILPLTLINISIRVNVFPISIFHAQAKVSLIILSKQKLEFSFTVDLVVYPVTQIALAWLKLIYSIAVSLIIYPVTFKAILVGKSICPNTIFLIVGPIALISKAAVFLCTLIHSKAFFFIIHKLTSISIAIKIVDGSFALYLIVLPRSSVSRKIGENKSPVVLSLISDPVSFIYACVILN